jgi:excisionase family DNA binding protein
MKQEEEIERYWPALKAARILGVSPVTLRKMAVEGKIDSYLTPGRKYRYRVSSFLSKAKQATDSYHKRQKAKQLDLFEKKDKAEDKGATA